MTGRMLAAGVALAALLAPGALTSAALASPATGGGPGQ